jgi:hypothetical protein
MIASLTPVVRIFIHTGLQPGVRASQSKETVFNGFSISTIE